VSSRVDATERKDFSVLRCLDHKVISITRIRGRRISYFQYLEVQSKLRYQDIGPPYRVLTDVCLVVKEGVTTVGDFDILGDDDRSTFGCRDTTDLRRSQATSVGSSSICLTFVGGNTTTSLEGLKSNARSSRK
jgi:hypothetical protein